MSLNLGAAGKYRSDIDGLRAIAVGSVVAFHAFPNWFKGGFVGVDIFFVISGFLISGIISEALEGDRFSYSDFYARRIKRIFPALVIVSAATFLVGWYVLLPDEFRRLGKHLAAGAGFVSNLILWSESGYFDASADTKPLLHLWSLGIEEQFYIVWPIVLGLVWKLKRGFFLPTLSIAVMSFAFNVTTVGRDPIAAFYSPLPRFWELMLGGILAYLLTYQGAWFSRFGNYRSGAGLLLIFVGVFTLNREFAFPGYWALLPTLGTFLVISAGTNGSINRYILGNRLMVGVGLISYPLYLWHWPILVFFKIVKGKLLTPTDRVTAVAASVALAFLTYRFIERPLRRSSNVRTPRDLAIIMLFAAAVGLAIFHGDLSSRLKSDHITLIMSASYDWEYPPVAAETHSFGALRYFRQNSDLGSYTLFFGDSNMEQYGPRIDRTIKEHPAESNGAIMVGNQQRCRLLSEILTGGNRCSDAISQLKTLIDQQSTRAVVIAVNWIGYKDELASLQNQDRFVQFLRSIASAKRVYVILNTPSGDELAPINMFEGSRLGVIIPKAVSDLRFDLDRFEDRYRDINQILSVAATRSGAVLIDPVPHLCPQRRCPIFDVAGKPLYLDAEHLNRSYAVKAATYIDATLNPRGEKRLEIMP